MSHILRNQMYLHLNCKEILDSLTYYKWVLQLGNLHDDLHSHFGRHWRVNYYSSCS